MLLCSVLDVGTNAIILGSTDEENLFFPLKYPTSCLLGCVDMLDCIAQEEYKEKVWGVHQTLAV